jgi:hypothetical protein
VELQWLFNNLLKPGYPFSKSFPRRGSTPVTPSSVIQYPRKVNPGQLVGYLSTTGLISTIMQTNTRGNVPIKRSYLAEVCNWRPKMPTTLAVGQDYEVWTPVAWKLRTKNGEQTAQACVIAWFRQLSTPERFIEGNTCDLPSLGNDPE